MIIYFSGTGNSYSIAKQLGERLNDDVVPLKGAKNDSSDKIIFVFPTYCYDIPPIVRDCIRNFVVYKYQTIMGISVSGGENGNSEYTFNKLIEAKGSKVAGFANVIMTDNSMPILLNRKVEPIAVDMEQVFNDLLNDEYMNQSKNNRVYKLGEKLMFSSAGQRLLRKKVAKMLV